MGEQDWKAMKVIIFIGCVGLIIAVVAILWASSH